MARVARRDAPGAIHHVVLRGIERRQIFRDDRDRSDFIDRMDMLAAESDTTCFAWALIPNHVHMLLRTGPVPLSRVMSRLNTGYARAFNIRHQRVGYLFQGRYKSILVEDDVYLRVLVRYVHLNPIAAGLVESLDELAAYPWTGHSSLTGELPPRRFHAVDEVLSWFDSDHRAARRRLLAWMRDSPTEPAVDDLDASLRERKPGSCAPLERPLDSDASRQSGDAHLPAPGAGALGLSGWTIERVVEWVCSSIGVPASRVASGGRSRAESEARAIIGHLAVDELQLSACDVSRTLGVSPGAMSRAIRKGRLLVRERAIALAKEPPRV
jgi:putative transposase